MEHLNKVLFTNGTIVGKINLKAENIIRKKAKLIERHRILQLLALAGVLVFLAIQPSFSSSNVAIAAPSVSITNPNGTTPLGEDQDYMSQEWHDAWDMNEESDIYFYNSPTCPPQSTTGYNSINFSGGVFSANQTGSLASPWFWLIHPGYLTGAALHVGKDGNVHPIDANKYTQLTFRMWMNADPANGTHLIWTRTDVSGLSQPSNYGLTKYFKGRAGWNIYTVDLTRVGLTQGSLAWSGNITGLGFFTGDTGITSVKIDWVRLTPKPTTRTVTWSGAWLPTATAQLYYSTDNFATVNDPLYVFSTNGSSNTMQPDTIPAGSDGTSGSYAVPASFPAGSEYIKVKITDGTGNTTSNSAGPWQFNAIPDFTFVAPSYTSGDDFATRVVGNAWDMNDSTDFSSWGNVTSAPTFSNGIMTATSTTGSPDCQSPWGDPLFYLNMNGQSIDSNKYRYLTIRMKIDRSLDFGNGWVARVVWGSNGWANLGLSNDMPLYQNPNWNAQPYWLLFNLDMWGSVQDEQVPGNLPWRPGPLTGFRIDPHEIPPSTTFDIDYIKLTANDSASRTSIFTIKYLLDARYNANFCFDTNRDPSTGCTPATGSNPSGTPTPGPLKTFLPLIFTGGGGSGGGDPGGTRIYYWNVSADSVVVGQYYYICASVNNSYNVTQWCSETPLILNP